MEPDKPVILPATGSWPKSKHRFDKKSVMAINAAIASRRPLLLRGEPGIGKSQLARAVAKVHKVPFLYKVLDERSERDDLFYQYDAIARLAEAQVAGLLATDAKTKDTWREHLAERNFIRPGVLWWAFDWDGAAKQAERYVKATKRKLTPWEDHGWTPKSKTACGPVVLVDEIDKTDPSVPNGLLEGLGNQGFQTDQLGEAVSLPKGAKAPLILITTNEERELPAAFLRRCLVLRMTFPKDEDAEDFLLERARVHIPETKVSKALRQEIVERLLADRKAAHRLGMAKPGAAEFLDLIRILATIKSKTEQKKRWEDLSEFTFRKHVEPER